MVACLRTMIEDGELRPGDRLPGERELAKQLGISRASLRSGLDSLEAMGVLKSRHGAGTFVVEGPPTLVSEPLSLLAFLHGFSLDQMFEARRVLEVTLAGLAAENATRDQLKALAAEIDGMSRLLHDPAQYLIHDVRFHRAVAAASGNPILVAVMEMVSAVFYQQRRETIKHARDTKESLGMHRRIFVAIRAGQAAAARKAMSEHLLLAQKAMASEQAANPALVRTVKGQRAQK